MLRVTTWENIREEGFTTSLRKNALYFHHFWSAKLCEHFVIGWCAKHPKHLNMQQVHQDPQVLPAGEISAAPSQSSSQPPSPTASHVKQQHSCHVFLGVMKYICICILYKKHNIYNILYTYNYIQHDAMQYAWLMQPNRAVYHLQDFRQIFVRSRIRMVWSWIRREVCHSLSA